MTVPPRPPLQSFRRPLRQRTARLPLHQLLLGCLVGVAAVAATGCGAATNAESPPPASGDPVVSHIATVLNGGGRVDWSRSNVIAFDQLGSDSYYDVFTMNPDGSGQTCLTCGKSQLPGRHIGNPAWHPSGEYLAIQVQKANAPSNSLSDYFANPGSGINNDIWIMNRQGTQFWQLTNVPLSDGGVLHPHFSFQGDKLLWSQRLSARGSTIGEWALEVADFSIANGVPSISNIRQFQPGQQHQFYESHGFTPDGSKIIFSGNLEPGQATTGVDIYTFDLASGALTNLTNTLNDWDEHAQIMPGGDWIVWMSSMGKGGMVDPVSPKTDYWIMRTDGSQKRQITNFNVTGDPQYIAGGVTAADSSWNADGTRLMAYLIVSQTSGTARTVVLDFTRGSTPGEPGTTTTVTTPPGGGVRTPAPSAPSGATAATGATRIVATAGDRSAISRWNDVVDALAHDRTLALTGTVDDPLWTGESRDRFVQLHDGVPVYGAGVVRQRAGSRPVSILGTVYQGLTVDVTPALSADDAAARVARDSDGLLAEPVVEALVVLPAADGRNRDALAYQIRAIAGTGIFAVFVDAHTGATLATEPLVHRWPESGGARSDPAGTGQPVALYDMRARLKTTLDAVGGKAGTAGKDWLASFSARGSDQDAGTIAAALGRAVAYVTSRLTPDPLASGRPPVALIHPQSADGGAAIFATTPVYAGGGIIVFPERPSGDITTALAAHYVGHSLIDSTSGMRYLGRVRRHHRNCGGHAGASALRVRCSRCHDRRHRWIQYAHAGRAGHSTGPHSGGARGGSRTPGRV